jgi:hypothetical protein
MSNTAATAGGPASGSGAAEREKEKDKRGGVIVRRPEDVFGVVKDRVFSWSYMMQWYQG